MPSLKNKSATKYSITKLSTCDIDKLISELDVAISPFFSKQELEELAKETGFVQRESKIGGALFLDLIVFIDISPLMETLESYLKFKVI